MSILFTFGVVNLFRDPVYLILLGAPSTTDWGHQSFLELQLLYHQAYTAMIIKSYLTHDNTFPLAQYKESPQIIHRVIFALKVKQKATTPGRQEEEWSYSNKKQFVPVEMLEQLQLCSHSTFIVLFSHWCRQDKQNTLNLKSVHLFSLALFHSSK